MSFRPFHTTILDVRAISPSFIRLELGGPELDDFGPAAGIAIRDLRIKLILPTDDGRTPQLSPGEDWYPNWLELAEADRGYMRTFSVRERIREASGTRLLVDVVRHPGPESSGPAGRFAKNARPGDALTIIGPTRDDDSEGGIEFAASASSRVHLFGDETAVPAACRILEDLPAEACGRAWLEVPTAADVLPVAVPAGVEVTWLPRNERPHGQALLGELGEAHITESTEDMPWEVPGEAQASGDYYWIAGEASTVTTIRRHLVRERGVDKARIAFMGYWKIGVAMRG